MSSSLKGRITALVHPEALSCPATKARHEAFILHRLLTSGAAVCLMPLYLAFQGAPAVWQILVFAWLMLPLAALALVARTGALRVAQALCAGSVVAVGLTMVAAGRPASGFAWLVLASLEGLFSLDVGLIVGGGAAAAAAALGIVVAGVIGWRSADIGAAAFLAIPAILYATSATLAVARFLAGRQRSEDIRVDRYRVLSEAVGDLVLCHDRTGAVDFVSRNCEALFGLAPRDLMGRGFFDRIHVGDRPGFLKAVADAVQGGDTTVTTLRLRTTAVAGDPAGAGEPVFRWVEARLRPFAKPASVSRDAIVDQSVVGILRDVTSAKLHEQELEAARVAAEEASVSKDNFLASISHELRTPLNAIIGFAEMLNNAQLTPRDPEKQREYAGIIQQSGHHLLSVVNSILDMSKIQAGSFDLLPEPFDIAPLIDLCCDMLKLKAREGRVELVRAYPNKLEEVVGDKRACKQILINLLSNAVKFTPPQGRVTIGARPEGNVMVIEVSDNGIGINARDLVRLGDPFFQAKTSYDRPYEGTGLGLSVVRGLVGLHGGSISVESEPKRGTSVKVRLPLDCRCVTDQPAPPVRIETMPRRSRLDESALFSKEMMVKKIA